MGEEVFYFGQTCFNSTHLGLTFKCLAFTLAKNKTSENQECEEDHSVEHDSDAEHEVGDEPPLPIPLRPLIFHYLSIWL